MKFKFFQYLADARGVGSVRIDMAIQPSQMFAITLDVIHHDGSKASYHSPGLPITIGRATNNSLVLQDENVSRYHLRVDCLNGNIVVEDLKSRNGTFVKGRAIPPRKPIIANSNVTIGSTKIFFGVDTNKKTRPSTELPTPKPITDTKADNIDDNTKITSIKGVHPNLKIELLVDYHPNSIITNDTHKMFTNITTKSNLKHAMHTLTQKILQIFPDILDVNYIFFKTNSFFAENFNKTLEEDLATFYRFVHEEKKPIAIKTIGDLEIVKKIIIPVKHYRNLMFLVDIDIDRKLSLTEMEKFLEIKSLIDFCASSFDSFLLREELDQVFVLMLETIISTVEAKDTYTFGHSERVCRYATIIGEELDLSGLRKKNLIVSALCHDIGKIAVPDAILKKPTLLSIDEFAEMKAHPSVGADIVRNIPGVKKFIGGIKHHHERWNGTGYPDGLKGENIPLFARIIAVVDAFDAMTSGRTYSNFIETDEAVDRITTAGKELFDPEILKIFTKACSQGRINKEDNTFLPEP